MEGERPEEGLIAVIEMKYDQGTGFKEMILDDGFVEMK